MKTKNKKILIIIGGGISAYKSLDLIRLLKKNGFDIKSVLTKSGRQFVTPLSLVSLSGGKVYENLFDKENEAEIDHIALSRWADLILVVPATANLISKLSQGKADDLSSTIMLASNKDIVLVPAMNVRMWDHKATQENCKKLLTYGYKFLGPTEGQMACGEFGKGKMLSPKKIFKEIKDYFYKRDIVKSKKLRALVTTGPTREYLDPVRFISNESSGKQGYEIALALKRMGVKTTLIAGPSNLQVEKGLKIIKVKTSDEMFSAVKKNLPVDVAVCTAAVSDFKPSIFQKNKIKKNKAKGRIDLNGTIDILNYLGKNNQYRPKLVIGFSAETEKLLQNSKSKLKNKNADWIIANDVSKKDIGFNKDYNAVTIIRSDGKISQIKKNKKSFIASIISGEIIKKLLINDTSLN
ncbi:MAG: bifunctional phosphopantothenoylcysteine decarboxylase/phosphopantothenate--cysteine ligase CoaBC [Candidatus Pelagibacter sp.]|nr:bifunctional phosphopantothenoylcysteine decarboxylase/phosphopantothenate--cysteine ligase CoaBC [Candidatus Pelagibacter sp.]OUW67352.1 MAG: phosphopantothenate synthase [Candidatus Pelagibacter sp. TMED202]